jgi:hypothetical protein
MDVRMSAQNRSAIVLNPNWQAGNYSGPRQLFNLMSQTSKDILQSLDNSRRTECFIFYSMHERIVSSASVNTIIIF